MPSIQEQDVESSALCRMTSKFSVLPYSSDEIRKTIREILVAVQRLHESGEAHGRLAPDCFVCDHPSKDLRIVSLIACIHNLGSILTSILIR